MKNTFFILVTGLLLNTSVQAQKKKTAAVKQPDVPENVNNSFKSLYTVTNDNKWNKNYSGNYIANFVNGENLKQTVEFSSTGSMIKSKVSYAPESLPENVNSAIAAQYPNIKITEASKLQMPGVAPYYRIKIVTAENATKELLISEEGTITE